MENITDILRIASSSYNSNMGKWSTDEEPKDTTIWEIADGRARGEENKTAITLMMEDFTKLTNSFYNNRSCINSDNTKKDNWFFNLFSKKNNNLFTNTKVAKSIEENGAFTQYNIYEQEIAKNGGVKYKPDDGDIYESALNFAKAEIGIVEKALDNASLEYSPNGKLEYGEMTTYNSELDGSYFITEMLKDMDFDGKEKSLSAEEYASFIIAIDGLKTEGSVYKATSGVDDADGKISQEEAELAGKVKLETLIATARSVYNEHYGKGKK